MAISHTPRISVRRLARIGLATADAGRLAAFYMSAFGFRPISESHVSGAHFERLMGVAGGAKRIFLGLGDDVIELLEFDLPGAPYPRGAVASDLIFQHFAIVTSNIHQAFHKLSANDEWSPISFGGPQLLPKSSGGVTAFKFRDPDGHPLELLEFPDGNVPVRWNARARTDLCLGIDHSAISISDSARSIAFYENIGLRVAARSVNQGLEQERLDNLRDPHVEVTALLSDQGTPHIELLCYRSVIAGQSIVVRNNDIAATRLVFELDPHSTEQANAGIPQNMLDLDGHHLVMMPPVAGARSTKPSPNSGHLTLSTDSINRSLQ